MAKKKADPKDFSVKWGDVPLLLEDPYGSVAKWINDWMPLALGNFWSPSQVQGGEVLGSRYVDGTAEIPFPKPCWSQLPTPRLNVLVWPNGASRWAYGLFLIDGKSFKKVTEKKGYTNRSFVVYDRGEKVIDTKMYALPPQPVSNGGGQPRDASKKKNAPPASDGNLYILPLVCPRYFWSHSVMEGSTVDAQNPGRTWDELLAEVNASVPSVASIDYSDPAIDEAVYFKPDWHHTNKRRERAAALADAIASSVGGHLVAVPESGGVSLKIARWEDYPRGSEGDTAALEPRDENPFIAGVHETDEIVKVKPLYPQRFRVVFRKYKWGRVLNDFYEKSYDLDGDVLNGDAKDAITNLEKVIISTAYAKVAKQQDGAGGADPDNNDDLDTLAEQLAIDAYHRWTWSPAVQCVAGIYKLNPDDADTTEKVKPLARADYVEFHLGSRCDVHLDDYDDAAGIGGNSRYRSFTRWVGLPPNFGPDVNLCQFDEMPTYYSPAFFTLKANDATEGDNATLTDPASDGSTADNYAKLWSEIIPIASHTGDVIAYWNANNEKWQVMQKECT